MPHSEKAPNELFLAKLSLPVRKCMSKTAVECAGNVAGVLSLDKKETYRVKLAVDEAFCNAVDHFSGSADEERVHLEFSVRGDALVISIRERGIPFDHSRAERFSPGDPDSVDKPGLGSLLMHQAMDSVELFIHGREGKEVRLTRKLRYGNLPQELLDTRDTRRGRPRTTVREPEVRLAREDELAEVCRLAWRCYGFTQEAFLYDLDALTAKVRGGEFKSVVGVDPASGALIGHAGLKYHDPTVRVPELGLVFVDPAYRAPTLAPKMVRLLFDKARAEGDRGVFDCSVTTHTFSQKGLQKEMGCRPCCLMLGIAAAGMQVKELATSRQAKGSVVNHYFPFDRSAATVYLPEHHQGMAGDIYRWMDLPRTFGEPGDAPLPDASSVDVFPLPDELNAAFIVVRAIGADTVREIAEGLRRCRENRMDAIYAFLPAGVPTAPGVVDACERMGFFFAGVMPHVHDGQDRILLQYIDIPLDPEAIRVYGDMSRKLFAYILEEQRRVASS
ncbi:GNAT family N-acetyltransferase [Desulfovibrio sp. Huiquan2017]|uniref:GNAT family N-acetyltransferase n=1 Tax=Desulfovibrio sp. Huiquan2017 TaxID=2816861 RepID=UPI001A92EA6D|nr:GNAT family N-acetyltransferase [Desulfovibrio sp. Huiquan2017]